MEQHSDNNGSQNNSQGNSQSGAAGGRAKWVAMQRQGIKKGFKDPNKPKGKRSSYVYFMQHFRKAFGHLPEYTRLGVPELAKEVARRWKEMSAEEKQPYFQLAEEDSRRFSIENAAYLAIPQNAAAAAAKRRMKKKGPKPEGPKRPLTAFLWFCSQERPKLQAASEARNEKYNMAQSAKTLGAMWRTASPAVKYNYEALATRDKERYHVELVSFMNLRKEQQQQKFQLELQQMQQQQGLPQVQLTHEQRHSQYLQQMFLQSQSGRIETSQAGQHGATSVATNVYDYNHGATATATATATNVYDYSD